MRPGIDAMRWRGAGPAARVEQGEDGVWPVSSRRDRTAGLVLRGRGSPGPW